MEEWEKQKFKALQADGTLERLSADVRRFCAPLWCWRETGGLPEVLHGGTVSFVDTGAARIAVTCHHVIVGLLKQRHKDTGVTCQIGNEPFAIETTRFEINASADLVTFELSGISVEYFPAPRWRPAALAIGEPVYLGGYPKIRRSVRDRDTLDSDFVNFHGRVEDASGNHAELKLDSKSWFFPGDESVPPYSDYGGMSGGPAFRGDLSLPNGAELAGIVFNSHINDERVYVRQLHRITAEGYII